MADQLQVIEIHLWVLTGLLTVILLAAGYCNYSRMKEQAVVSPCQRAKDLWEREQFVELRNYTTAYLKERPNTANVLMYDALVAVHFKDYVRARRDAEKMLRSPDHHKLASSIFELLDADAASAWSRQGSTKRKTDQSVFPDLADRFRKNGLRQLTPSPLRRSQ